MLNPENSSLHSFAETLPKRRQVVSLTPLIDVVFILLVFFMLASSFLDWRSIELDAAAASTEKANDPVETPLLAVSASEITLDGEPVAQTELVTRLKAHLEKHPESLIRVRPLEATPLQPLVSLLDELQARGITQLTLVRDPNWDEEGEGAL